MILNDITNDSATTGAESDIYRAKGKEKKKGIKIITKMFNQCEEIGRIIWCSLPSLICSTIARESDMIIFLFFWQFSIKGKHDLSKLFGY